MPPKVPTDEVANADVRILIELIRSATEFKADTSQMAAVCGLSAAKNVPRKINSIVSPFGYEFKGGKIVSKDGSENEKSVDENVATNGKAPKTPKNPKTPKSMKNPATKSPKKRKIEEATAAEDDNEVETEAMKVETEVAEESVSDEPTNEESVTEDLTSTGEEV